MSKLFLDVLDGKRLRVFKLLDSFGAKFMLSGGTAISLQLGHRKSYDFDLASPEPLEKDLLPKANKLFRNYKARVAIDTASELTLILDEEIKVSFFHFPFETLYKPVESEFVDLYSLEDLASNKAYVIGRRGEWRDYVDMYFLLVRGNLKLDEILTETKKRFAGNFDEKLFWEQLVYWSDIKDFEVDFAGDFIEKEVIQKYFGDVVKAKFSE